jgi:hypothetical protein
MDRKRSQQFNYCYEALPIMFHSQTKDFLKYLEKDGLAFLEFWWNHVGERLPFDKLTPFTGMAFESFPMSETTKITILTLPKPKEEGEMYYMGLISNPEKRFAWVRLPSTRVVGLVKKSKETYESGTELGDVTPRAIYVSIGEGPEPTKEAFKQAIINLARRKSR